MKRRSIITSTLLFALSLSVTVGCNNPASENRGTNPPGPDAVKMGHSAWTGWAPWQVAQTKGIFQNNKVDVDLQWTTDYQKTVQLFNAGKLDGNNQTLPEIVAGVANGMDQVIVLTTDNSTGADKIIVNDKIKSIKDLKGKKVATEMGSVDHFLLAKALKKAGMTMKDITLVPMESSKAAAAFAAGKVDAASIYDPFTTAALKRPGSWELFSSSDFLGSISDHLVFSRKFVNAHPEKVQAIVDTWFDTLAYINTNEHEDEVTEIMAKRLGITAAEHKRNLDGVKMFSVEDNIQAFGAGNDDTYLANTAISMSNFLFENGLIKTKVDTSKLFDDRFVKAYAAKKQAK